MIIYAIATQLEHSWEVSAKPVLARGRFQSCQITVIVDEAIGMDSDLIWPATKHGNIW